MGSERNRTYDLDDRLIDFACRAMDVMEALPNTVAGRHIAGQMMRSGTAPAANYAEAQGAESRADFVHKMKLALKELRETRVWLQLTQRKSMVEPTDRLAPLLEEVDALIAIFVTSIGTAKKNMQ